MRVENKTFAHCRSLQRITIPSSVKEISWTTFNGCTKLMKVEVGDEIDELLAQMSQEDWWVPTKSLRMVYCFAKYCIPQRVSKIKAQKWRINIEGMLKRIPYIGFSQLQSFCASIDSKLSEYESLRDVASLLELALCTSNISGNSNDLDDVTTIVSLILSFLVNNAGENADEVDDDDGETYKYDDDDTNNGDDINDGYNIVDEFYACHDEDEEEMEEEEY